MNLEQYQTAQATIVLQVLRQTTPFASYFSGIPSPRAWVDFLQAIFPFVREGRRRSAQTSYSFFHSEHRRIYGFDDGRAFSDDGYEFAWFVKDMAPFRKTFTQDRTSAGYDETRVIQAIQRGVARATENGGREAMQHAVEVFDEKEPPKVEFRDPRESSDTRQPYKWQEKSETVQQVEEAIEPKKKKGKKKRKKDKLPDNVVKLETRRVKGWARVPTGEETCGWCLMLCSRGPVYSSAYTAGLELEDYQALRDYNQGQIASDEDMEQWHPGCDCKVVPVFDTRDWPGKADADRYLEIWNEATRLAQEELERNPGKKSFVDGQWVPTTLNREAINQMRRLVGEYDKRRSRRAA